MARMKLLSNKNARLIGGAATLGIAARTVIPAAGGSFALPDFNQSGIFNFYLPALVGIGAIFPQLLPFQGQTKVIAFGLLAIGVNALFFQGRTSFNIDNALFAYGPAVTGALLVA